MPDRVVTSPAGEEILVLDDESFAAALGVEYPSRIYSQNLVASQPRLAALAVLWNDGPIHEPSGLAGSELARRAGLPKVADLISAPALQACIEREGNLRRTHRLTLLALPERWLSLMPEAPATHDNPEREPEPPTYVSIAEPEPVVVDPAPVSNAVTDAVATALLARVVEIVSAGKVDAPARGRLESELEVARQRLASQIEMSERQRRDLRDAGDIISALKVERDGLRHRLNEAEHNLKVATSADAQRIIDAEVRKQIDRFMRQAPADTHG